eukprot:COSAG01_NODE_1404_length_10443_cov_29.217517_8_plen_186_part_00
MTVRSAQRGALGARARAGQVLGLLGMGEELDMVRVMAAIDLDGSGEVDLDEFAGWWLGLVRRRPHARPLRPRYFVARTGVSQANPSQHGRTKAAAPAVLAHCSGCPRPRPPRTCLTASAMWVPAQDGAQREEAVGKARALVLAPATLECTVVSARKLKKMDRLKGNDVFCVLIVDDDPQRTSTIW